MNFNSIIKHRSLLITIVSILLLEVAERFLDCIYSNCDGKLTLFYTNYIISFLQISLLSIGLIVLALKAKLVNYVTLIVTLIMIPVALEIFARVTFEPQKQISDAYKEILKLEQFKNVDEWLKDRAVIVDNRPLQYHDYYLFSPKSYQSKRLKYTNYFSSRNVPASVPIGKGDNIIWLFGGSTMQNIETTDTLSIANQVTLNLVKKGITPTLINFGTGSFQTSLESIKFQDLLRRIPRSQWPNTVVFYDGYNDGGHGLMFGAGNIQADLSDKLKILINGDYAKMLVYSVNNIFKNISRFWQSYIYNAINKKLFRSAKNINTNENLRATLDSYKINITILRAICSEFRIRPIFILQPMMHTKKNHTKFEHKIYNSFDKDWIRFMNMFYYQAKKDMSANSDFYDLSHILNTSKRNDFYDYGHTGPYTSLTIGKEIADIIYQKSKTN